MRNIEGYSDPTASMAIGRVTKIENMKNKDLIKRGMIEGMKAADKIVVDVSKKYIDNSVGYQYIDICDLTVLIRKEIEKAIEKIICG